MRHLAMVLEDCLNTRSSGFRVFAQKLTEFGNISLAEEDVKHVTSILGAFVKALLTLLEFLFAYSLAQHRATGLHATDFCP